MVSGGGTYDKMKNILHDHLEANKEKMFTLCTKTVQEAMQEVEKEVLAELQNIATEIFDHFYNDLETLGILPVGTVKEIRPAKKQQKPAVKTEIELILAGLLDLLQAKAEGAPDPLEVQIFHDLDKNLQSAIMNGGSQTLLNDDFRDTSRLLESPQYIHHPYGEMLKASEAMQFGGSSRGWGAGQDSLVSSQVDFTINEVVDSEFDSSEELSQKGVR